MSDRPGGKSILRALADRLGGGPRPARRVHLCPGPNCCRVDQGEAALRNLRERLAELGLDQGPQRVEVLRAKCMNVCGDGPVVYVEPEGTWYNAAAGQRLDRIIEEHLQGGRAVPGLAFDPPPDSRRPG